MPCSISLLDRPFRDEIKLVSRVFESSCRTLTGMTVADAINCVDDVVATVTQRIFAAAAAET